jgi:hypothetical protein
MTQGHTLFKGVKNYLDPNRGVVTFAKRGFSSIVTFVNSTTSQPLQCSGTYPERRHQ